MSTDEPPDQPRPNSWHPQAPIVVRVLDIHRILYYIKWWMVLRLRESAFKHGVNVESIEHAIDFWLLRKDDANDTENTLFLGPDQAGNILEILAYPIGEEDLIVFHAMPARAQFLALLAERKE